MASEKKAGVTRNASTGSYTVRVPKSAATGSFRAKSGATGRIEVRSKQAKKQK